MIDDIQPTYAWCFFKISSDCFLCHIFHQKAFSPIRLSSIRFSCIHSWPPMLWIHFCIGTGTPGNNIISHLYKIDRYHVYWWTGYCYSSHQVIISQVCKILEWGFACISGTFLWSVLESRPNWKIDHTHFLDMPLGQFLWNLYCNDYRQIIIHKSLQVNFFIIILYVTPLYWSTLNSLAEIKRPLSSG